MQLPLPSESTPPRGRFNSRDLPRTYSGQYACGGTIDGVGQQLMPLECLQQEQFLQSKVSTGVFFCIYLSLILTMQFVATTTLLLISTGVDGHDWLQRLLLFQQQRPIVDVDNNNNNNQNNDLSPQSLSWTLTNLIHLIFCLMTIHFSKGSFLVVNQQGELNAMTVWEQLEATPESSTHMRRSLLIVPTILSYIAIWMTNFEPTITFLNVCIWCVNMLPKLSFMNGVRLFGINRTAGIDDDVDYNDRYGDLLYHNDDEGQRPRQQQIPLSSAIGGGAATREEQREGPSSTRHHNDTTTIATATTTKTKKSQ
jgi:hypothetical protein